MNCSCCGSEVEDDAKFCEMCGSPIVKQKICSSCQCANRADAKFCKNCGSSLKTDESAASSEVSHEVSHSSVSPEKVWSSAKFIMACGMGCEDVGFCSLDPDSGDEYSEADGTPWGDFYKGVCYSVLADLNDYDEDTKQEGYALIHESALSGYAPAQFLWAYFVSQKIVSDNDVSASEWEKRARDQHDMNLEKWLVEYNHKIKSSLLHRFPRIPFDAEAAAAEIAQAERSLSKPKKYRTRLPA